MEAGRAAGRRSPLDEPAGCGRSLAPGCAAAERARRATRGRATNEPVPRARRRRTRLPPLLRAPRSAGAVGARRRRTAPGRLPLLPPPLRAPRPCAPAAAARPAPPGRPSARSVPRWARLPRRLPHAGTGIRCGLASYICPPRRRKIKIIIVKKKNKNLSA